MTTYVPIDVTGTLTIAAGSSPAFSGSNQGEGAYFIDSTASPSLLSVLGTVTVTDSTVSDTLAGITAGGTGSQFKVGGGGSVIVNGSGAGDTTFGFFATDQSSFENDGTYSVTSAGYASGVAIDAASGTASFLNTGAITVSASGTATTDTGQGFGATGVATAVNSGSVAVSGQIRVDAFDLTAGGSLTNSGTITATSSTAQDSYGVVAGGVATITNSGTITAYNAINALTGAGATTVTNTGTINGNVVFDSAPGNTLVNSHAITGEVYFAGTSGLQLYDGRGGTLHGVIVFASGATGSDVAYLGNDGEVAQGGSANLTVYGGAGADTIVGGSGVNYIDGGAGNDTLTGGGTHDTFVMDANVGQDLITDFNIASDVIDISAFSSQFTNLASVLAASSQTTTGGVTSTTIHLGATGSVTLSGVSMNSLTAADFHMTSPPTTVTGSSANSFATTFAGVLQQYTVEAGGTVVTGGPENANDSLVNIHRLQFVDGYEAYSTSDPAAEVYRLYEATLNRGPDQGGLTGWTNALNNGTSLQSVANGFVSSAEFQTDYGALDNAHFINLLYENVLHRGSDPTGQTYWLGQMSGGMTQAQVVLGFTQSPEDINDLAAPVQQGLWVGNPNAAEVARLYDTTLGRLPDAAGLAYWTNQLQTGTSLQTAVNGFVGSPEFQNHYGALGNNDFVAQLYENTLHRAGDPAGLGYWTGELNSSAMTRAQVVLGFSDSAEHVADTAPHIDSGIWVV